jgi:hypothetical protein
VIGEPFGGGGGLELPFTVAQLGVTGDQLRQGGAVGLAGEGSGSQDFFSERVSRVHARFFTITNIFSEDTKRRCVGLF